MPVTLKPVRAAALAATLFLTPAAQAQDAADASQVLATVNGTEITLAHVIAVRADLPPQYDQFPVAVLFDAILEQLIQQTLLVETFDGDLSLRSQTLLENERRAIVAGEVIGDVMSGDFDEAALTAAYDEQYPDDSDNLEYRAAHILVDTEEEAKELITELESGAQFAALARERSTGPSASVGGDLGWFGDGDMVTEFFDAVVELEPGEVSAPVQTDFGWHVINLTETRAKQRPDFETVRAELEAQMRESKLEAHVAALAEKAQIERADTSEFDPETINNFELLEN